MLGIGFAEKLMKRSNGRKLHKRKYRVLYNIAYLHGLLHGITIRKPVMVISHVDMLVGNVENGVKVCHTITDKNQK